MSPVATSDPTRAAGARVHDHGVEYLAWAPDHAALRVEIARGGEGGAKEIVALQTRGAGYFGANDPRGRAGDWYQFVLSDESRRPDMWSRFQPRGVHGPSECIDPRAYRWRTDDWRRPAWRDQVLYELHVGTFTHEGTFRAAVEKLDEVRALGVTAIELMPVADFAGDRNWGYDGVSLFAPARCYGRPDDLRQLVDEAHARGLAVILDVVYNHLGPDGNYLSAYAKDYFHRERATPWGQAFNLDQAPVRGLFLANAAYWLDEFRFDGLRLDATHAIVDEAERHLLAEIADVAHARGAFLIAEDERNSCAVLRARDGRGHGIDAVWADDFHHQVRVAVTGRHEAYFANYAGTTEDLATTLRDGWFYHGQVYPTWKRARGEPCAHLPVSAFVTCIENHDQVGNRARGERLEHLVSAATFRAASALVGLSPYVPMLFMGQEWAASSPFMFFTDHHGELGRLVSEGRKREFSGLHGEGGAVPDPQAAETFVRSKLQWEERESGAHAQTLALYRVLLSERAAWLRGEAVQRGQWDVHATGDVLLLHYRAVRRLVAVALRTGGTIDEARFPAARAGWRCGWHTEEARFGGAGDARRGPVAAVFAEED